MLNVLGSGADSCIYEALRIQASWASYPINCSVLPLLCIGPIARYCAPRGAPQPRSSCLGRISLQPHPPQRARTNQAAPNHSGSASMSPATPLTASSSPL